MAELIKEFEPAARKIQEYRRQQDPGAKAHLVFNYGTKREFGKPVDPNTISTRIRRTYDYMAKREEFEMTQEMADCLHGVDDLRSVLEEQARLSGLSPEELANRQVSCGRQRPRDAGSHYLQNVHDANQRVQNAQDGLGRDDIDDGGQSSDVDNPSLANDLDIAPAEGNGDQDGQDYLSADDSGGEEQSDASVSDVSVEDAIVAEGLHTSGASDPQTSPSCDQSQDNQVSVNSRNPHPSPTTLRKRRLERLSPGDVNPNPSPETLRKRRLERLSPGDVNQARPEGPPTTRICGAEGLSPRVRQNRSNPPQRRA